MAVVRNVSERFLTGSAASKDQEIKRHETILCFMRNRKSGNCLISSLRIFLIDDIQHHIIEIGIEIAIGVAIGHTDDGSCVLPYPRDSQVRRYDRQYNLDRILLKTKYDQIV